MKLLALILVVLLLGLGVAALLWHKGTADQRDEPAALEVIAKFPVRFPTPPTTANVAHEVRIATARSAPIVSRPVPDSVWDAIAQCESGGRWDDTRGGYEGGVHFLHSTWVKAGGRRFAEHAYQASREEQIEIAKGWLARTSWEQWPACSRKVGAR